MHAHPHSLRPLRPRLPRLGLALLLAFPALASAAEPARFHGEITSGSALNANDGSRHQDFTLQLKQGEAVRVRKSGPLEASLALFGPRDMLVAGPQQETLTALAPRDGSYTLAVSGRSHQAYGPFELVLEQVAVRNSGALQLDDEVLGMLAPGAASNLYTLAVDEAGLYRFDLKSDEFDAVLRLDGGTVTAENDDGGNGTDAALSTFLQPGEYRVTATGYGRAPTGAYTLAVAARPLPEGVELSQGGALAPNGSVTGLAHDSATTYTLAITERALLRLRMSSTEADSYLRLSGPGVRTSDDDSGGGLDAEIVSVVAPGTYSVEASSVGESGLFTLTSELTPVQGGNAREVAPGQTVAGNLRSGGQATTTLRVREAGSYRISLYAGGFDAVLALEGQGEQLEDDDSAGGSNARLETWLQPGNYRLTASAYGNRGGGDYVLAVEPR